MKDSKLPEYAPKYKPIPNDKRKRLLELIHKERLSIKRAAELAGIRYSNAKTINQIYMKEKRTIRKTFRFRLKNIDIGKKVERNHLMTERLLTSLESTGEGISPNQRERSLHQYKICSVVRLIKRDKSMTT